LGLRTAAITRRLPPQGHDKTSILCALLKAAAQVSFVVSSFSVANFFRRAFGLSPASTTLLRSLAFPAKHS